METYKKINDLAYDDVLKCQLKRATETTNLGNYLDYELKSRISAFSKEIQDYGISEIKEFQNGDGIIVRKNDGKEYNYTIIKKITETLIKNIESTLLFNFKSFEYSKYALINFAGNIVIVDITTDEINDTIGYSIDMLNDFMRDNDLAILASISSAWEIRN